MEMIILSAITLAILVMWSLCLARVTCSRKTKKLTDKEPDNEVLSKKAAERERPTLEQA